MTDHTHDQHTCTSCSGVPAEQIEKQTMDNIIAHGHQVRFIFPVEGSDGAPFWYSIGRTLKNRPELLMTGPLDPRVGHHIINLAANMDDETPFYDGMLIPADTLLSGYPVRIVAVDPKAAQMFGAINYFGDDVTALQIVWPDMEGRFPDEEGFAFPDAQPVYAS